MFKKRVLVGHVYKEVTDWQKVFNAVAIGFFLLLVIGAMGH